MRETAQEQYEQDSLGYTWGRRGLERGGGSIVRTTILGRDRRKTQRVEARNKDEAARVTAKETGNKSVVGGYGFSVVPTEHPEGHILFFGSDRSRATQQNKKEITRPEGSGGF